MKYHINGSMLIKLSSGCVILGGVMNFLAGLKYIFAGLIYANILAVALMGIIQFYFGVYSFKRSTDGASMKKIFAMGAILTAINVVDYIYVAIMASVDFQSLFIVMMPVCMMIGVVLFNKHNKTEV